MVDEKKLLLTLNLVVIQSKLTRVIHKFDEDVFEYNVPFSNISAYMLMVNDKKI